MFTRIVAIILVVNFGILFASGFVIKAKLRILDPVLKCYEGWQNDFLDRPEPPDEDEVMKKVCKDMEGYDSCIDKAIKEQPGKVPKVFNYYALIAYQTSYLYRQSKLCPKLTFELSKKIVEESHILKEERLTNIETDTYEECAGDALKKCTLKEMGMYEDGDDFGEDESAFNSCMVKEAKTVCNAPIMRHLMGQLEAYIKHVKELTELEEEEKEEKKARAIFSRFEAPRAN